MNKSPLKPLRPRVNEKLAAQVAGLFQQGASPETLSLWLSLTFCSVNSYLKKLKKAQLWRESREVRKKRCEEQKMKLQKLVNDGLRQADIALVLNVSRQRVNQLIKRHSVRYARSRLCLAVNTDKIVELYSQGASRHSIVRMFGVTHSRLSQLLCQKFTAKQRKRADHQSFIIAQEKRVQELVAKFTAGQALEEVAVGSGWSVAYAFRLISPCLNKKDKKRCRDEYYTSRLTFKTKYKDEEIMRLRGLGMIGREIAKRLGCSVPLVYQRLTMMKLKGLLEETKDGKRDPGSAAGDTERQDAQETA
jgi:DNA-binding CsgD family transcriptional regulator